MPRQTKLKALPLAPLRLDHFWVEELRISASEAESDSSSLQLAGRSDFFVTSDDSDGFLVRLSVSSGSKDTDTDYRFYIRIAGQFSVSADIPDDSKMGLIYLNAPAILYGVARGVIATVTGMSLHGPLHLPSVNFVELLEESSERAPRASKANSGKGAANSAKPSRGHEAVRSAAEKVREGL